SPELNRGFGGRDSNAPRVPSERAFRILRTSATEGCPMRHLRRMGKHLVIGGNGPVGRHILRLLATEGGEAAGVSRTSGLRFDASDADALTRASAGASTLYLCAMPRYDRWPEEFPLLMESTVVAAERVGARIVSIGNTYPYGEGAPPTLTEDLP